MRVWNLAIKVFAVSFLAVLAGATPAFADSIDLGLAGNYAVFGLGSSMSLGTADSLLNNTAEIFGSVAVGADTSSGTAAGTGTFQKGFMTGDLVVDTQAQYTV